MAQADFISKQIKARKLPEGGVTAVMMQDFVWKAFVAVVRGIKLILLAIPTVDSLCLKYLTDRNWNDWQNYYRSRADNINRAARARLMPEKPGLSQVVAEMERLHASGGYDSPPANGASKRSLEGSSDGRRPKRPRL